MQNGFPSSWVLSSKMASLSAALKISSSEGSSAASGMGGHHEMVGSSGSLSPSVEAASSSEEGSLTVSLAPSGLASFIVPGSNWRSSVAKKLWLQPMGIKVMDTRDDNELSILYTNMKEHLVTSMSMN